MRNLLKLVTFFAVVLTAVAVFAQQPNLSESDSMLKPALNCSGSESES